MLAIKTGEFSIGKLMVKNCMDAIFNQPPLQHLPRLPCKLPSMDFSALLSRPSMGLKIKFFLQGQTIAFS
ncbi:MAG: hypothetical protein IJM03_14550 [Treponema sp.]|nr:hypothetical protein [Treponema sp.]